MADTVSLLFRARPVRLLERERAGAVGADAAAQNQSRRHRDADARRRPAQGLRPVRRHHRRRRLLRARSRRDEWHGLDVDVCRAIAAAVLGDATKVRFTPLTAAQRFTALQTGEIDVLSRITTITFQRDVQLGIEFPATNWYDGTGFIVRKALNVQSAKDSSTARPSACSRAPPTRSTSPTTSARTTSPSRRSSSSGSRRGPTPTSPGAATPSARTGPAWRRSARGRRTRTSTSCCRR